MVKTTSKVTTKIYSETVNGQSLVVVVVSAWTDDHYVLRHSVFETLVVGMSNKREDETTI